jgi:hypothetical protein
MPSVYQKASLNALLALFLEAQGHPLPQQTSVKSASSLSRFLNHYDWSTRRVIGMVGFIELLKATRKISIFLLKLSWVLGKLMVKVVRLDQVERQQASASEPFGNLAGSPIGEAGR